MKEQFKAYMKAKYITYVKLGKLLGVSHTTAWCFVNGTLEIPRKRYEQFGEIFPLNKAKLKKGILEFNKRWK